MNDTQTIQTALALQAAATAFQTHDYIPSHLEVDRNLTIESANTWNPVQPMALSLLGALAMVSPDGETSNIDPQTLGLVASAIRPEITSADVEGNRLTLMLWRNPGRGHCERRQQAQRVFMTALARFLPDDQWPDYWDRPARDYNPSARDPDPADTLNTKARTILDQIDQAIRACQHWRDRCADDFHEGMIDDDEIAGRAARFQSSIMAALSKQPGGETRDLISDMDGF